MYIIKAQSSLVFYSYACFWLAIIKIHEPAVRISLSATYWCPLNCSLSEDKSNNSSIETCPSVIDTNISPVEAQKYTIDLPILRDSTSLAIVTPSLKCLYHGWGFYIFIIFGTL